MIRRFIYNILLIFTVTTSLVAQHVGIGVSNPTYPLDVSGTFRLQHTSNTAGLWFDGLTLPTRSFIGTFNQNSFGFYGSGGAGWSFLINETNDNIGVGVQNPVFRLDVNGRVRFQKSVSSAGIIFDGTTMPTRSIIGSNNDNIGIYGNGGTGWNFIIDGSNGYIGIGTATPTKPLDLNGSLRIRSNAPVKGSVLISKDVNGNSEWANPIGFMAEGNYNNETVVIPNGTWQKVFYHQSPLYNVGNHYLPNTSDFVANTAGIYEFHANVGFTLYSYFSQSIRLRLDRGGVISTIAEFYNKGITTLNGSPAYFDSSPRVTTNVSLLPGDKIWVEAWVNTQNGQNTSIAGGRFSGSLVVRN